MKSFKLGKYYIDTKSMIVGLGVCLLGLSIPQTQSFFEKMLQSVKSMLLSFTKGGKK